MIFQKTIIVLLSCILLLQAQFSWAELKLDKDKILKSMEGQEFEHLYVKSPKEIQLMETVTYYITYDSPYSSIDFLKILLYFKKFGDKIGYLNGAVYLNPEKSEYLDYTRKMKCKELPDKTQIPLIIFEKRKEGKCIRFSINDPKTFYDIMAKIYNEIDNISSDLSKSENKKELKNLRNEIKDKLRNQYAADNAFKSNIIMINSWIDDIINSIF